MKKIFKHFSIFVLFLAIVLAFSGCGKKSPLPPLQKGETKEDAQKGKNYMASSTPTAENNGQNNIATSTPVSENGQTGTSNTEIAETATSTEEIDTIDWKTYRNEEYGFEIKYPSGWNIDDEIDTFICLQNKKRFNDLKEKNKIIRVFDISIQIYKSANELPNNSENLPFEYWLRKSIIKKYVVNKELILLDDIPAYKVMSGLGEGAGDDQIIYVKYKEKIYELTISFDADKNAEKIISSFKFIDKPPLPKKWLKYEDKKNGFEIKYPEGYDISSNDMGVVIQDHARKNDEKDTFLGGFIAINIKSMGLKDYINELNSFDPPFSNVQYENSIKLNENLKGTELSGSNAIGIDWVDIFFRKDNKSYIISYNWGDKIIQDIMVASFKFSH